MEACDLPSEINQGMPMRACHPAGELLFYGIVRYRIGDPSAGCYTGCAVPWAQRAYPRFGAGSARRDF